MEERKCQIVVLELILTFPTALIIHKGIYHAFV